MDRPLAKIDENCDFKNCARWAREEPENHSRTLPYKSAIAEEFLKNFKFARPIVTSASQLLHTSTRVRDGKHIRSSAQELLICTRTNYHPFPIVFLKENDSKNRDFREKKKLQKIDEFLLFLLRKP